jgi:WD40 repeat protein
MDADVVVAGSDDGHVRLWDIASGNSYPPLLADPGYRPSYGLLGVRVWLGGTHPRILLTEHRNLVAVWDVSDPSQPAFRPQAEIATILRSGGFDLHAAKGLPRLATLDGADEVVVFDLLAGTRLFQRRIGGADSVKFIDAPDHPLIGVGARGKLHLLDVESGEQVCAPVQVPLPSQAAVGCLDGADVLAALDPGGLRLYDLRTGEPTIPPVEMSITASGIAWGRVGDRDVVVTAHYATVRVWNPRTGREITVLRFGTRIGAVSVQQTDGGRLLVAVSGPGLVLTELREISS